jgi:tetratricopeptide (TPR) repeat protein
LVLHPVAPSDAVPTVIVTEPLNPERITFTDRTPRSAEMDAVIRRANQSIRHAFELAEHGAIYSARSEFISALQTIAEALDARRDSNDHVRSLNEGLRALLELDDFSFRDFDNPDDSGLAPIVAGHRTPVLKDVPLDRMTAHAAMSHYLTFAEQQLAASVADIPAGSTALYGLGKIYTVPESAHGPADATHGAKAVAMHEAALAVDGRNFRAANELGVLLVRFGRLPEARAALLHSLEISPQPATWQNLAAVHQALGENRLAALAGHEAQLLANSQRQSGVSTDVANQVRWVDPTTFARSAPMQIDATPGANSPQSQAQNQGPVHHSLAESVPWSTSQR